LRENALCLAHEDHPVLTRNAFARMISCFQSKLHGEAPGGISFANESIFIFTLKSSGDNVKITSVQDFVDTKQTAEAAAAAAAQR
jgi:hypothetical protein